MVVQSIRAVTEGLVQLAHERALPVRDQGVGQSMVTTGRCAISGSLVSKTPHRVQLRAGRMQRADRS